MKRIIWFIFTIAVMCAPAISQAGEDSGKVSNLKVIILRRLSNNYVQYSIKADVHNDEGRSHVTVKVVAKNKDGFEVHRELLGGIFEPGQSRSVTTTTMVKDSIAADIDTWEIDSVSAYKK